MKHSRMNSWLVFMCFCAFGCLDFGCGMDGLTIGNARAVKMGRAELAAVRVAPKLRQLVEAKRVTFGAPIFIRIFKREAELELWGKQDKKFVLLKTYPICTFSGSLGPKLRQGDHQAPEGFYRVARAQLNPTSSYHLSFNLGYPNAYDRAHQRTGNYLMVHGNCVSIGCYAMGDDAIEEIYTLMEAAFARGQKHIEVHAMPFRLTSSALQKEKQSPWFGFWSDLAAGFDAFEKTKIPPMMQVREKRYQLHAIPAH